MRILLLIALPIALPFAAWKLWRLFGPPPRVERIEDSSGTPVGDDIPLLPLTAAGVVLVTITLGANILLSDEGVSTYTPPRPTLETGADGR